ncbi:MAG: LysR family transcriptional regulator, partial [Pseudomonadota bacterium]|nr:LysR family transcriptional regulator [Pseudomonadota bacterium]
MDTLTCMRVFVTVVATGSFTAAADRLNLSKAMVSRQVFNLEKHLATRLLNRTTRRLSLTES